MLGCDFQFHSNFNSKFCAQTVQNLVLRCLSMCYKMDARLVWVNEGVDGI